MLALSERERVDVSFFTHLECSVPCGAGPFDARANHHLCTCGMPLLARYDLVAARHWPRESLVGRVPSMWRYRELLPIFDTETPVTLGEGFTPLVHATRLGQSLGLSKLYVKDESLNPTNSFKARGQSAAVTRAKYPGGAHAVGAVGRQCGQCHGGLCGSRRHSRQGLHAARREDPVHPRM